METEEAQEMAPMPGKRLPTAWLRRRVQKVVTISPQTDSYIGLEVILLLLNATLWVVRWVMDVCWCVSAGRDSPPANEASEEAEEPMAVPEDLSASSTHQQNNRGDKGMSTHGQSGHHWCLCRTKWIKCVWLLQCYFECIPWNSHQNRVWASPSCDVSIPKASRSGQVS